MQDEAAFLHVPTGGRSAFRGIVLSHRSVSIVGDWAIAGPSFAGETASASETVAVRIGVMQVRHRDGERWRLLARQAFEI